MVSSEECSVDDDNLVESDAEEDLVDDITDYQIKSLNKDLKLGRNPHIRSALVYVSDEECPHQKRLKQNMEIQDVVMDHALRFLPAKSLCRFKAVSKDWYKLINKPFFAHQQGHSFRKISGLFCQIPGDQPSFISLDKNAYGIPSPSLGFLPKPVTIRTACNGLLCCQSSFDQNRYYICNPVNKEWKVLPEPTLYHGPDQSTVALAFEPKALNFKAHFELVCAVSVSLSDETRVIRFEIYSSRSSCWRLVNTICCEADALKLNGDGFFLKGVVFWETSAGAIVAFDLNEEQYGIMSLPPKSGPDGVLTEMHGELCYLLPVREGNDYTLEIYGDMDMNLKRVVPLDLSSIQHVPLRSVSGDHCEFPRVLACVNDDSVIILVEGNVIAYDMEYQAVRILKQKVVGAYNVEYSAGFAKYVPYVNSFVRVRSSYLTSLLSEDPSTS